MKPDSRGTVRLTSPDPRAPLAIDHGFLTDERDVAVLVDGVEALRRWRRPTSVRAYAAREARPGAEVDAERHVREAARGFFHPVGTCAIGAVVDGDGRVHGCEGLSVADASIMPSIPRANTNLSTIALAERLAERMLGGQLTSRSSGHTTRSTRAKAPRCRRSGVSHAVCRHGSSGTPSFAAGAPASASSRWSELPVALSRSQVTLTLARVARRRGSASRRWRAPWRPESAARSACRDRPRRGRARGGRRAAGGCGAGGARAPRPRGGRAARCRAAPRSRWPRARRRTAGAAAVARAGARATSVPTPEALSSAPGAGGTVSACAMAMTRQRAGRVADADDVARGALARHGEALEARRAAPRRGSAPRRAGAPGARRSRRPGGGRRAPATPRSACASAADGGAAAASVQQPATRAGSTRRSLRTRLFRARRRASLVTSGAGSPPRQVAATLPGTGGR